MAVLYSLVPLAYVGLGGAAGSLARYGLTAALQRWSIAFPLGTLGVNLAGCLCIGFLAGLSERTAVMSDTARLLLITGFCGGFTTLSSVVYESAQLLRTRELLFFGLYTGATLLGSALCFVAGLLLVRLLVGAR